LGTMSLMRNAMCCSRVLGVVVDRLAIIGFAKNPLRRVAVVQY
jgi:hypothetical protein